MACGVLYIATRTDRMLFMTALQRLDLRGASVLVTLARWTNQIQGSVADRFMRSIVAAFQPDLAAAIGRSRSAEGHSQAQAWLFPLKDSTSGLLSGMPLLDQLGKNRSELSARALQGVQRKAGAVLSALMKLGSDLSKPERAGRRTRSLLDEYPALGVVRRPLEHRFVIPPREVIARAGFGNRGVAGLGQWHPVIRSLDDLLAWACANVLGSGAVYNVGRCEQCGRYYFSARRKTHRFCPDSDCRDRYWSARTGAERSKKSRSTRREGARLGAGTTPRSWGS